MHGLTIKSSHKTTTMRRGPPTWDSKKRDRDVRKNKDETNRRKRKGKRERWRERATEMKREVRTCLNRQLRSSAQPHPWEPDCFRKWRPRFQRTSSCKHGTAYAACGRSPGRQSQALSAKAPEKWRKYRNINSPHHRSGHISTEGCRCCVLRTTHAHDKSLWKDP